MASISAAVWVLVAIGAPPIIAALERRRPARPVEIELPTSLGSMHVGRPFLAQLPLGTVELIGLAPNPAVGAEAWQPDGSALGVPFPSLGGVNTSSGNVEREIAFHVRSEAGAPSSPVLRFAMNSGFGWMGTTTKWDDASRSALTHTQAIACPPTAKTVDITVGVADGPWQTVHTLRKPTASSSMSSEESSEAGSHWWSSLELAEFGENVALGFRYSVSHAYQTRMALIKADGSIAELTGNGSHGDGVTTNSIRTLSASDYAEIKEFQFQKRPYQWVAFRKVSLQLGNNTEVESVDAVK